MITTLQFLLAKSVAFLFPPPEAVIRTGEEALLSLLTGRGFWILHAVFALVARKLHVASKAATRLSRAASKNFRKGRRAFFLQVWLSALRSKKHLEQSGQRVPGPVGPDSILQIFRQSKRYCDVMTRKADWMPRFGSTVPGWPHTVSQPGYPTF